MNLRVICTSPLWTLVVGGMVQLKRQTEANRNRQGSIGACSQSRAMKRLRSYGREVTSSGTLMPSLIAALGGWPYWGLSDLQTFFLNKNSVRRWRWAMAAGQHKPLPES